MPQTTAMAAKMRKRIASILFRSHRHQKRGDKEVDDCHREHECPGEMHQLVVAKARQRAADPNEQEQNEPYLSREPEEMQQNLSQNRNQEDARNPQEHHAEDRKSDAVKRTRRIDGVVQ